MALSEQERKLLEQLEASLIADDPKLAETLRGTAGFRIHRRRAFLGGLGFLVGVVVLILGVQIHEIVSILGFVLMLASTIIGINSWQVVAAQGQRPPQPGDASAKSSRQDFMQKLDERWRHDRGETDK